MKKILRSSITGELGVNLIQHIVMGMGFLWHPTGQVEAGIDGYIELRDTETGQVFNTVIGVQSKATARPFPGETTDTFIWYCTEQDLNYWLMGNLPVVLVVSRPTTDEAYWISVKEYFRDPARRATRRVQFDKQMDRFDPNCRDALFKLAAPRDDGLYLAPPEKREQLLSNLLPVAFLPARLYVADTEYRDRGDLFEEARRTGVRIGWEWILRSKRILSFCNLRRPEWAGLCDQGTVEDFACEEWSQTDDEDRRREFVDLLKQTLRAMVRDDLNYHGKFRFFYFRPTHNLKAREVTYQSLVKVTDRTVFKAYKAEDGNVKYYRHSAFEGRFHRFDGQWYLEITPTYHFTSDGFHPSRSDEDLRKGIKQTEGHEAVRGQVIMWAAFLMPRLDLFDSVPYPFLGFGDLVRFQADRGIDDAGWDSARSPTRNEENGEAATPDHGMMPLFKL